MSMLEPAISFDVINQANKLHPAGLEAAKINIYRQRCYRNRNARFCDPSIWVTIEGSFLEVFGVLEQQAARKK